MAKLSEIALHEVAALGADCRDATVGVTTMEAAARRVVDVFWEGLQTEDGEPALVLARIYKTHPHADLPPGLTGYVNGTLDREPEPDLQCLTLLGTRGVEAAWNDRQQSQRHRAIPLESEAMVASAPMIASLLEDLGVPISFVIGDPDPEFLREAKGREFNVFYIEEAKGSPYIPDQDSFVEPHGVRSVIGFGALLPSGALWAAILFARVRVPRDVADRLRALALNVNVALLPFDGATVFDPES